MVRTARAIREKAVAAQSKRLKKQLEGLDMAEKMAGDLLSAGIGTLGGASAQTYEKLAKDLGNYYLAGPQTFLGLAGAASFLAVRTACFALFSAMSWGTSAVSKLFWASCSNIKPVFFFFV